MNRSSILAAVLVLVVLGAGACGEQDPARPGVGTADCRDTDGDGFGLYCEPGPDCDESDAEVHEGCMWCSSARPAAGCPCEGEAITDCYSGEPVRNDAGEEVCMAGERTCVDGAWGECEYTEEFPVPDPDGDGPADDAEGDESSEEEAEFFEEVNHPPYRVDPWNDAACNVCGNNYRCTSWAAWTNPQTGTYLDNVPVGAVVYQVLVDLSGTDCAANTEFEIRLNGQLVQRQIDPMAATCACNSCQVSTYTSAVVPAGFPGYVYRGVNTVSFNRIAGLSCLSYSDVRVRYRLCGNGVAEPGEACDDGNAVLGDGCEACAIAPVDPCGNGLIVGAERCDDGNAVAGDGCDARCQPERGYLCNGVPSVCVPSCGNGVLDAGAGEQCDDGNADDLDACRNDCTRPNGVVVPCGPCDLGCAQEGDWPDQDDVDDRGDGVLWDDVLGGIVIGTSGGSISPYSWVANSSQGTVSKVDQNTGREVGRYYTGPNAASLYPSRTAIDGNGDAYVANRAITGGWFGPSTRMGTIIKIASDPARCRNGAANTSNNNIPRAWGTDDCVLWEAQIGALTGSMPRGLAISKGDGANPAGYVWVGATADRDGASYGRAYKLDPDNGATICSVGLPVSVYGATSDGSDPETVWFSSYLSYGMLAGVDAETCALHPGDGVSPIANTYTPVDPGGSNRSYAVSTDGTGRVIAAGFTGRVRIFDPSTEEWCYADVRPWGTPIGVTADAGRTDGVTVQDPRIWASAGGFLTWFDVDEPCVPANCTASICTSYSAPNAWYNCNTWANRTVPCGTIASARVSARAVGSGMGVGADFTANSRMWVVNSGNSPVFDPLTNTVVTYPIGSAYSGAYTYSDFTGFAFRALIAPEGTYHVDFGDPPACGVGQRPHWGLYTWDALTPAGTSLEFRVQTARTLAGLDTAPVVVIGLTPPDTSPPGIDVGAALRAAGEPDNEPYIRVTVALQSSDRASTPVFRSQNLEWTCSDSE